MRYEQLSRCSDAAFRRFCGVPKSTFEAMLKVLELAEADKKPGRPNKLSLPDQLLLALSYRREYRTPFHIGAEYGLHESTAQRIVCKVEDRLAESGRFALSPRDTLLEEGPRIAVVALDATESPIERPQKTAPALQLLSFVATEIAFHADENVSAAVIEIVSGVVLIAENLDADDMRDHVEYL